MTGNYLEQQSEAAQNATSPGTRIFSDETARLEGGSNAGAFWSAVPRIFCCLSMLSLLLIWPSSDWIGLLALSQALLAAAYLLKSTSPAPVRQTSTTRGPVSLARGEDHAR